MTKQEQLARLHNRLTSYEIVAVHADGRRVLIGYSVGKSKNGIYRMMTKNGPLNGARLGLADDARMSGLPASKVQVGPWVVAYTGRTQRDAIIEGELPWIEMPVMAAAA